MHKLFKTILPMGMGMGIAMGMAMGSKNNINL